MRMIGCRRCEGSGLIFDTRKNDEEGDYDYDSCELCDGSGFEYEQEHPIRDKVNEVVLIWGYFCLVIFIYAILFGEVKLG